MRWDLALENRLNIHRRFAPLTALVAATVDDEEVALETLEGASGLFDEADTDSRARVRALHQEHPGGLSMSVAREVQARGWEKVAREQGAITLGSVDCPESLLRQEQCPPAGWAHSVIGNPGEGRLELQAGIAFAWAGIETPLHSFLLKWARTRSLIALAHWDAGFHGEVDSLETLARLEGVAAGYVSGLATLFANHERSIDPWPLARLWFDWHQGLVEQEAAITSIGEDEIEEWSGWKEAADRTKTPLTLG